jgi:hypothetical protein
MDRNWKWCLGAIAATWAITIWASWMTQNYMVEERTTLNTANELMWPDTDDGLWVAYAQWRNNPGNSPQTNVRDNFGEGRLIGWSPTLTWVLQKAGWAYKALHPNLTLNQATERAAIWTNPLLLAAAGSAICVLLTKLVGAWGLIFYGAWMLNKITAGAFSPTHPDHQGILLLMNMGLAAGVLIGLGKDNRRAFQVAGLAGGIGLGLSAANALPIWMATGGAMGLALLAWKKEEKSTNWSQGWRDMGWIAGTTSLLLWGIDREGKINLMLEVNSPLHSLAVWGACHAVAATISWGRKEKRHKQDIPIAVGGLLPMLLTMAVLGRDFIASGDPVGQRLMWIIVELQPTKYLPWALYGLGAVAAGVLVTCLGKEETQRGATTAALAVYGSTMALALSANRFEVLALTVGSLLLPVAAWIIKPESRNILKAAAAISLLIGGTELANTYVGIAKGRWRPPGMENSETAANIAAIINQWEEETGERAVVLDPKLGRSSKTLYYLKKGCVGQTIYWEAIEGMKTSGGILANADEEEAKRVLWKTGTTHLVLQEPKEIGGTILAMHGRKAGLESKKNRYRGYAGTTWATEKQEWLEKTPIDGVWEVNRNKLGKEMK